MKEKKREYRNIFLCMIVFFILPICSSIIVRPFMNGSLDEQYFLASVYDLTLSIIQASLIIALYSDTYKEHFHNLKERYKESKIIGFIIDILIGFLVFMLVKIAFGIVSEYLGNLLNIKDITIENQSTIVKMLHAFPISMFISATILAPIIEETVFRRSIRKIFKNKRVFITVSGLIFGIMHVVDSVLIIFAIFLIGITVDAILSSKESLFMKYALSITSSLLIMSIIIICIILNYGSLEIVFDLKEIIGDIPYIGAGLYLAYTYAKRDNIYYNIGIHSINNLISMIVLLSLK